MSSANPWSLFGVDLSRAVDYLTLGWQQLLWDGRVGLRSRHYPSALLHDGDTARLCDEFAAASNPSVPAAESTAVAAYALPDHLFLLRSLRIPESAEADLARAVGFDISGNSPFPEEDCCSGWRITGRSEGTVMVAIAIVSRAAVHAWLRQVAADADPAAVEVWAPLPEGGHVVCGGFGEGRRRRAYHLGVRDVALHTATWVLSGVILLALPGAYAAIRANQLQDQLDAVQAEARVATRLREELSEQRAAMEALDSLRGERVPYHYWLHTLAAMTPDSVYLLRMQMEGPDVEATGFAGNAADYLSQLADSGRFRELDAPGAFTRDRASGLERFTITLTLPEAVKPDAQATREVGGE